MPTHADYSQVAEYKGISIYRRPDDIRTHYTMCSVTAKLHGRVLVGCSFNAPIEYAIEDLKRQLDMWLDAGSKQFFQQLFDVSLERNKKWMPLEAWSNFEWAGALAGEAGEALNAAKKLSRLEHKVASINEPGRHFEDEAAAKKQIAKEYADVLLYMPLALARLGVTREEFEMIVREVFNRKSEEYGFIERL